MSNGTPHNLENQATPGLRLVLGVLTIIAAAGVLALFKMYADVGLINERNNTLAIRVMALEARIDSIRESIASRTDDRYRRADAEKDFREAWDYMRDLERRVDSVERSEHL